MFLILECAKWNVLFSVLFWRYHLKISLSHVYFWYLSRPATLTRNHKSSKVLKFFTGKNFKKFDLNLRSELWILLNTLGVGYRTVYIFWWNLFLSADVFKVNSWVRIIPFYWPIKLRLWSHFFYFSASFGPDWISGVWTGPDWLVGPDYLGPGILGSVRGSDFLVSTRLRYLIWSKTEFLTVSFLKITNLNFYDD